MPKKKDRDPKKKTKIAARRAEAKAAPTGAADNTLAEDLRQFEQDVRKVLLPAKAAGVPAPKAFSGAHADVPLESVDLTQLPSTMAQIVAGISVGKIQRFDPVKAAELFRDSMSVERIALLGPMFSALAEHAKTSFYPSTVLLHIQCGARVQTYYFDSTLKPLIPTSKPDTRQRDDFASVLAADIHPFLKAYAFKNGGVVLREFAPHEFSLLGDAIYPFGGEPMPVLRDDVSDSDSDEEYSYDISKPLFQAFINVFNDCGLPSPDQSRVWDFLTNIATAIARTAVQVTFTVVIAGQRSQFAFGTKNPAEFPHLREGIFEDARKIIAIVDKHSKRAGEFSIHFPGFPLLGVDFATQNTAPFVVPSDPSKFAFYLKHSADKPVFNEVFHTFSEKVGISYIPGSVCFLRFDDSDYVGQLSSLPRCSPDEALHKRAEFAAMPFDQEVFESTFRDFLIDICRLFVRRGGVIISVPGRNTFIGAFDPDHPIPTIKALAPAEAERLLSSVCTLSEPLLNYVELAYRPTLQASLQALKDFIGTDGGVICKIEIAGKLLFSFGKAFEASEPGQVKQERRKLRAYVGSQIRGLVEAIADCLRHYAAVSATITLSVAGHDDIIKVEPLSRATSAATVLADRAVQLQAEINRLEEMLAREQEALVGLKLCSSGAPMPKPGVVVAAVKEMLFEPRRCMDDLRAQIASQQQRQEGFAAEMTDVAAQVEALKQAAQQPSTLSQELAQLQEEQGRLSALVEEARATLIQKAAEYDALQTELMRAVALREEIPARALERAQLVAEQARLEVLQATLIQRRDQLQEDTMALEAQTAQLNALAAPENLEIQQLLRQKEREECELHRAKLAQSYAILDTVPVLGLTQTPFGLSIPVFPLTEAGVLYGFELTQVSVVRKGEAPVLVPGQYSRDEFQRKDDVLPIQGVFAGSVAQTVSAAGCELKQ